ncbi:unnamed protein product [Polarella glacialis]|uniref:Uncharacterized protein n=1 Tax=Polarella glacialis TaxID=89957 RepID=A0A813EQB8_POLGL|nr:unnamed protein product [Polarella glacialis]
MAALTTCTGRAVTTVSGLLRLPPLRHAESADSQASRVLRARRPESPHRQRGSLVSSAVVLVGGAVRGLWRRRRRASGRTARAGVSGPRLDDEDDFDYGAGKEYWDKRYQTSKSGSTYDWPGSAVARRL